MGPLGGNQGWMVSLGWVPAVGLVPCLFVDWPPYVGGQGEPRERGDRSRLLGDSFKKQGNLNTRWLQDE